VALTDQEKIFIDAYCGEAEFKAKEAAKIAKYVHPERMGYEVLKRKAVSKAIQDRLDTKARTAWYSQEDIQKALWEEVNTKEGRGNTQAARISALVWLGKSIGMWNEVQQKQKLLEEQRKEPQIQYNIINYANSLPSEDDIKDVIDAEKNSVEEQLSLPEGIEIINYNND